MCYGSMFYIKNTEDKLRKRILKSRSESMRWRKNRTDTVAENVKLSVKLEQDIQEKCQILLNEPILFFDIIFKDKCIVYI